MKINKIIKIPLVFVVAVYINGCGGSGSSGSREGNAAGLDMLDLSKLDHEKLAKYMHNSITFPLNGNALLNRSRYVMVLEDAYGYEEEFIDREKQESKSCEFGGSMEVIKDINIEGGDSILEIQYDNCYHTNRKSIDGYTKSSFNSPSSIVEYIYKDYTITPSDPKKHLIDVRGNANLRKGIVSEIVTGTSNYTSYYNYSVSAQLIEDDSLYEKASYTISGYKNYEYIDKYIKIEATDIVSHVIADEIPTQTGCRTNGTFILSGKNNSKITIKYNEDHSMDFTVNGKTEHWHSCIRKNP